MNDLANGLGILKHRAGDCYEGNWVRGKNQGYGVYTHASGAKYSG